MLETAETPISAPVHDTLDKLITHNRRVNYRVEPPPALPRAPLDSGDRPIADISRTHITVHLPTNPPAAGHVALGRAAHLAGTEIPISGRVHRVTGHKMTIELDLMIDEFVPRSRAT